MSATTLSLISTKVGGDGDQGRWVLWLAGVLPVAIAVWLGAGVGLYLTGFYAASSIQALLLRARKTTVLQA